MKQIRIGTLHVAGHDNHLYGLCDSCLGVQHLGVLGGEYNIFENDDHEKYTFIIEREPQNVLNEDIKSDPYSIPEAYGFELVDGMLPKEIGSVKTPCRCKLDRIHFERFSGMKF